LKVCPPKRALQNLSVIGAIKQRPHAESRNGLWELPAQQLRHAPVIEEFSARMVSPKSFASRLFVDVAHSRRDSPSALRYVLCRAAICRPADACTLRQRFDGRAQSAPAGANDQQHHVMPFVGRGHRIRIPFESSGSQHRCKSR